MPVSEIRRATLLAKLPAVETTRERVLAYMGKADIGRKQFGKLLGYSEAAIVAFIKGTYTQGKNRHANSDVLIREAAEAYMDRHPLGVVDIGPGGHLYETENVRELRRWFEHCQANRALAFVYGPPGSQKTYVLQHLIAEFNRRELAIEGGTNRAYYVRASINIQPRDLVAKICMEAGAMVYSSVQRCMASLRFHLRHTQTVIVLDEAQLCGIPALEALRELHDTEPRLGILLAGSHGLKTFFDQRAAELEQWNSRLDAGVELSGVSDACARVILGVELPDLGKEEIAGLIEGSRVQDIFSRDKGRTYLNMRRLFKNIAALRQLDAAAQEATTV